MNNPAEIQEFLQRVIASDEAIISNARTESGDTDVTIQVNITRVVENGLTTIRIRRNAAVFNAAVPPDAEHLDEVGSTQEYVDKFVAFVAEPSNEIDYAGDQFVNLLI